MSLAPEGYPFVAISALMAMATWIISIAGFGGGATEVIAGLFTLLTLFNLWFFRDPNPLHPTEAGLVLAPAEGRVIDISEVSREEKVMSKRHQEAHIKVDLIRQAQDRQRERELRR